MRRKHCALAVVRQSQKISPHHRPPLGGAGRPEFNHLEMVTTISTWDRKNEIIFCNPKCRMGLGFPMLRSSHLASCNPQKAGRTDKCTPCNKRPQNFIRIFNSWDDGG